MESVTVIVATFGAEEWDDRGIATATATRAQHPEVAVVHHHGRTLATARNGAAFLTDTEWLCFLDADDELEPGYIKALLAPPVGDLRAPAVAYQGLAAQTLEHRPSMAVMNQCVIGTLIRRDLFQATGGFWEEPIWEDWSLFRRAWLLGASIVHVPEAVYRSNSSPAGRNSYRSADRRWRAAMLRTIMDTTDAWHAGNPPAWKTPAR